jgi:hypothetical protein
LIKQKWTIEEISIFSNNSHLEWRAGCQDTILKGIHPRTIPARLDFIWFSGFRRKDLNVIWFNGFRGKDLNVTIKCDLLSKYA